MSPEEQLQVITQGRIWQAVQQHLGGDWQRRNELFTIPQSLFDAWADSVELPYGQVQREPRTWDGVYAVEENGRWVVYVQERGCRVHECGTFNDYRQAKRQALATEYLYGIMLRNS
jgi:hypothetical protein